LCVAVAGAVLWLAGCATPMQRFHERVHDAGLTSRVVRGSTFNHLVVSKPGDTAGPLHVYIEGDGTPWLTRDTPARDPTPNTPLAFELMLRDPQAALYLGRPCYFGVGSRDCAPQVWTHERYSAAVVDSMAHALIAARGAAGAGDVVLLGHSGGGVLAVLLANETPDVVAIVTVGANLDVAAWSALHGYSPLVGSVDPARLLPARGADALPAWHHVGGKDRIVPPAQLLAYALGRPGVTVVEWPAFDHTCCWADVWKSILATLPDRR
jgi:hypothetical protein